MPALQWRDVLSRQRKCEVKRRPVPDRALNPDLSPMHLHDLLNDREAQASPRNRLRGSASDAAEALEDVADIVGGDANARVGDADQRELTLGAAGQRDRPAVWRVLDRAVDEVAHHLDEAVAVAHDEPNAGVQGRFIIDPTRTTGPGDRA